MKGVLFVLLSKNNDEIFPALHVEDEDSRDTWNGGEVKCTKSEGMKSEAVDKIKIIIDPTSLHPFIYFAKSNFKS